MPSEIPVTFLESRMYLGFSPLSETLPVFCRAEADTVLYYAPGFVLRAVNKARPALEAEVTAAGSPTGIAVDASQNPLVAELLQHARAAKARWKAFTEGPYEPVCLTLYLDNRCNLRCAYCYSDPAGEQPVTAAPLRLEVIRNAAELVAQNCRRRGLPFTAVIHGGGEPTINAQLLREALDTVEDVAAGFALKTFKYLATNGVMPASRARWVASRFDLIGLSCDGPAEIQNTQRPRLNGSGSVRFVERTAGILRELDKPFHVRVTVTPGSLARQVEIVEYVCRRLAPKEIHIEPVYTGGREQEGFAFTERLAETFVEHFFYAQAWAGQAGIPLRFSGSRPWDIHGPFCQVFRDVLQLVPGEVASPCFKLSDAGQVDALNARIGWDEGDGFAMDWFGIYAMRKRLLEQVDPSDPINRCRACFNQYHCARACPDGCGLEGTQHHLPSFRCAVQMRLAAATIERAASGLEVSAAVPLAAAPMGMES